LYIILFPSIPLNLDYPKSIKYAISVNTCYQYAFQDFLLVTPFPIMHLSLITIFFMHLHFVSLVQFRGFRVAIFISLLVIQFFILTILIDQSFLQSLSYLKKTSISTFLPLIACLFSQITPLIYPSSLLLSEQFVTN
jgi:hypothetical protein